MIRFLLSILSLLVAIVTGDAVMAAGVVENVGGGKGKEAISSVSDNEEIVDDEFYQKEIDQLVVKVRPLQTPIDTIIRKAGLTSKASAPIIKYYRVGTKPITAVTVGEYTGVAAATAVINTDNNDAISANDILAVREVDGYKEDGTTKSGEELTLYVVNKNDSGQLVCKAINGQKIGSTLGCVPSIAGGKTLVMIGNAAGEKDIQAPVYTALPEASEQFCQNYIMQVEQSTIDKLWNKEVNFNFSDLEEDAIFRMKLGMEMSTLFGVKSEFKHPKTGDKVWTQEGIWYQAGKEFQYTKSAQFSEDTLIDLHKTVFTGTAGGARQKIIVCGSGLAARFAKATSDKMRIEKDATKWDLRLNGYTTVFGTTYIILHEVFDLKGMEDCGIVIDPDYLAKQTFIPFVRNVLELKKSGVRNTDAVVLQEMSCTYLRYPTAHCRIIGV